MRKNYIAMILLMLITAVNSGCSSALNSYPTQTEIEWPDIVIWDESKYWYDEALTEKSGDELVIKELGKVKFTVIGSKEEKNPDYQLKNEEAAFAPKGSKIYSIEGQRISEIIYVNEKVYKKN